MSSSVESLVNKEYKYGFVTDIESDVAPKGLNEEVIRLISAKKQEPEWLLAWILFVLILALTYVQLVIAPRWVHYEEAPE